MMNACLWILPRTAFFPPYYLAGYVHRYTYLKTSSDDEEDSEKEETPLSFAFAFTKAVTESTDYSFGSILPYAPDGGEITLKDGSKHTISLLFQFEDGLFAKFWQKYDAVLRHSFNQVDTNTLLPVHQLMKMDVLTPVALRGSTCFWTAFPIRFLRVNWYR